MNISDKTVGTLLNSLSAIPDENFTVYKGGWNESISLALIDAVFSIGARYETKNGHGVGAKVIELRDLWQDQPNSPRDDLHKLIALGEAAIRQTMGQGKVSPGHRGERHKSVAVIDAAQKFVALGLVNASDIRAFAADETNFKALKRAYTSVAGLGPVTFEYFLMLLGVQGVKADRMIIRFVEESLGIQNLSSIDARAAIVATHTKWSAQEDHNASLIEFDHAIWRYESERAKA